MNGASMIHQQRVAKRLLLLVCLLVLNCAAQPLARLALLDHALSCQALPSFVTTDDQADKGTPASPQPNSCQLNGKWLSATTLLCLEQLFFAVALLIALLAPLWRYTPPLPPPRAVSLPNDDFTSPSVSGGNELSRAFSACCHSFCETTFMSTLFKASLLLGCLLWQSSGLIRAGSPAPRTITPRSGCKPTAAPLTIPASCSRWPSNPAGKPTGAARVKGHSAPDPVGSTGRRLPVALAHAAPLRGGRAQHPGLSATGALPLSLNYPAGQPPRAPCASPPAATSAS